MQVVMSRSCEPQWGDAAGDGPLIARTLAATGLTSCALCLCSCAGSASLSSHMRQMQAQSDRLGRAIVANDGAAARASLEQLSVTITSIQRTHPRYNGMDLARTSEVIFEPAARPLDALIEASDWAAAQRQYLGMVESCNRCHAATGNERVIAKPFRGR